MKKTWLAVIGVVLLFAVVAGLVGCSSDGVKFTGGSLELKGNLNSQQEGIWVNGEGEVTAVPDVAVLRLGIEAQEATVAEARAEAADAMEKVKAALEEQGIDEKDIQTQQYSVQEVTRWDNDKQQEIVLGYRVTNTVTAKVREVAEAGGVIDAVAAAGGDLTRIDSISFTIDDPTPYQGQARELAVADAAAKAKQLADIAGVKLGKPTYISESSYVPSPIYRSDMVLKAEAASVETPISPGEMEITVNVQMAYAIAD
jgi:uncharacterized protein YggE